MKLIPNTLNSPATSPDELPGDERSDRGFTLVEILIAIVLVGILSAVVVVGISNLTSKGTEAACNASLDAAKAGTVVYFASNSAYPTTLAQLTAGTSTVPAALTLPTGYVVNTTALTTPTPAAIGMRAVGANWSLTMAAGVSGAAPTFVCS